MLIFLLAAVAVCPGYAQPEEIGSVINEYARVSTVSNADTANVDSVYMTQNVEGIFAPGDIALIIQVKGAKIYDPTTLGGPADWGKDLALNNTGIYSFMLVAEVDDTLVVFSSTLRPDLQSPGDVPHTTQLVKVPYYESASLVSDLQAKPWDPASGTGGVLALFVRDKLDLADSKIDVSGMGFLGGDTARYGGFGTVLCSQDFTNNTFYYDAADDTAGRKGESPVYEGYPFTRGGRFAFGAGGGGEGHNAGGGGGANAGVGGVGGEESGGICPPGFGFGSYGGYVNTLLFGNDENLVFMGSGGGASVPESASTAVPGGNGGGIVFIITDTLAGDTSGPSSIISAAGNSVTDTSLTGGGGGGAGGFIVLDIANVMGNVHLDVSGGKGGDTWDPAVIHGPGGGGGGGMIWYSGTELLSGLTTDRSPGEAGVHWPDNISGPSVAEPGIREADLVLPLRGFFFNFIYGDQDVCQEVLPTPVIGSAPKGDTGFVYTWQSSSTAGDWQNITGYSGDHDSLMHYYFPAALTDTTWFRRIVTQKSDPFESDTGVTVIKNVLVKLENNNVTPHDTVCYDLIPAPMNHTGPAITGGNFVERLYQWQASHTGLPGDWTNAGPYALGGGPDNTVGFTPGPLQDTTYFRRRVISHVCTDYSNPLTVIVLSDITGNTIEGDDHICQNTAPDNDITGAVPTGGDGANTPYEYVWQARSDLTAWDSIAFGQNYPTSIMDSVTTYYRRIVYSGKKRTCVNISESVGLLIDPIIQQNHIAPDTAICAETPTNEIYPDSVIFGAVGNYMYTYQDSSLSQGAWGEARAADANSNYDPGTLTETTWFRRIAESGQCTHVSDQIMFHVDPVIVNNNISPTDTTICAGTETGAILDDGPPSGGNGSYRYRWDMSPDRVSWDTASLAATSLDLLSRTLFDSTWFRRVVFSGACTDTLAQTIVNVHDTIVNNTIWTDREACDDLSTLLFGTTENNGLAGGTGDPADFEYLWQVKYDPESGSWETAPDGPLSNDQSDYETDTLELTDPVYLYRRYARSGECEHYSDPDTLVVRPRPAGELTSMTDTACFDQTAVQINVGVSFSVGLQPFRVVYSDGQGETGAADNLEDSDTFIVPRGSSEDASLLYTIVIDSIYDDNGCWTVGGEGSVQKQVYTRKPPGLNQETFVFCHDGQQISVSQGFGSARYWGPQNEEYEFESPNDPATIFSLNYWESDFRSYEVYWYQKNGTCEPDSVSMTVDLYQQPAPASVNPTDSVVYFRQSMPMWADSVEVGTGTWKDWDWTIGSSPPLTDIHNSHAMAELGGTDNLQTQVIRKLTWKVSNGVCEPDSVELTITRNDMITYSAFSPNGDGRNDYLILDGLEHAEKFTMRIFSRHGVLVKTITETDVISDPIYGGEENIVWDGKMENGSDAADGTYFYLIEVVHAGQTYNYKNYLELVRTEVTR